MAVCSARGQSVHLRPFFKLSTRRYCTRHGVSGLLHKPLRLGVKPYAVGRLLSQTDGYRIIPVIRAIREYKLYIAEVHKYIRPSSEFHREHLSSDHLGSLLKKPVHVREQSSSDLALQVRVQTSLRGEEVDDPEHVRAGEFDGVPHRGLGLLLYEGKRALFTPSKLSIDHCGLIAHTWRNSRTAAI